MLNNTVKKLLAVILLIAGGVVFLIFGAVSVKEMKNFTKIPAVVARIEKEWVPDGEGGDMEEVTIFVTYTFNGKEYTEELQNTKTNLKEGEHIEVLCNPEAPEEVSGATKGMTAIQLGCGAALVLAGLGTLAAYIIRGR